MNKTLNLRGLSEPVRNDHVNRAVAEHVAGFVWAEDIARCRTSELFRPGTIALVPPDMPKRTRVHQDNVLGWVYPTKCRKRSAHAWFAVPSYATQPNLVVPLIEKYGGFRSVSFTYNGDWGAELFDGAPVTAPTFALAVCMMLLQEHGVKVRQ